MADVEDRYYDAEVRAMLWLELAAYREQLGLTQSDIAERMGVRQSTVSDFERGAEPRLSTLQRYARALGGRLELTFLPGDALLGGTDG